MTAWRDRVAQLFVNHHRRLEAMVTRRVHNREVASELVQDVFSRVFKSGSRGSLDADTKVLYAAARNAATEHLRTEWRRDRIMDRIQPQQLACETPTPEQVFEGRSELEALNGALEELSTRCREIFILHRVEGVPNAEIAARFDISVSAVEKHIARALRHCQASLSAYRDRM
ncbi:RNA polymerase sigma-70 factor (ECF subfamily) [Parvibaculum indicum]|uniref:RNA polymerase sigma factor n=1 Tax=Parvibaculum indicum TaxID=562969 RepID=UPI00141EE631|nr:sigma-70 family RNA polymerase sigma factor [Parvibaculum indicum]NIJ40667.1 RNA polymerase sigma-70 factor (ECF subfamily) [Parvibaculum indicum]